MNFLDKFKSKKQNEEVLDIDITSGDEIDFLDDSDLEEVELEDLNNKVPETDKILQEIEDEKKLEQEKKLEEERKLEQETKKEVKKEVKKSISRQVKVLSPKSKALLSNLFLLFSLFIWLYLFYWTIIPNLTSIEIFKFDYKKVEKDKAVVNSNLEILDEKKDQALEYRRLNDLLEQAVPWIDKYEDNIVVILNLLKDSINIYSKNQKFLQGLSIKPNVVLKDIQYFDLETETIMWIEYNVTVDWFETYTAIKSFLEIVNSRLKIFHLKDLSISKIINKETWKSEYIVKIKMYSYYKVPKVDEDWYLIEGERVENTFN